MKKAGNVKSSKEAIPKKLSKSKESADVGQIPKSPQLPKIPAISSPLLKFVDDVAKKMSEERFDPDAAVARHNSLWRWERKLGVQEINELKFDGTKYIQYLKTKCNSCNLLYNKENSPYLQKCGVTICGNCNKKKADCQICFPDGQMGKKVEPENNLNKDLQINSSLIVAGFKKLGFDQPSSTENECSVGDELIVSISNKYYQYMRNSVKIIGEINEAEKKEKIIIKAYFKLLDCLAITKSLRLGLETIHDDQSTLSEFFSTEIKLNYFEHQDLDIMDQAIYRNLYDLDLLNEIRFGLRITQFKYNGAGEIATFKTDLFWAAVSTVRGKLFYYPIFFINPKLFLRSRKSDLNVIKNIFLVEYESFIESHKSLGFFFHLNHNDYFIYIEIVFDNNINPQIFKQILTLCTGDDGPCYTGGKASINQQCIMIESYISDGDYYSDDIDFNIPDKIGEKTSPVKGMVTVPRFYKEGARLRILMKQENNIAEVVVGYVKDPTCLDGLPENDYNIYSSGMLFSVGTNK